jgi:alkylation response protein AidB-like acyl-CoA dehydrogenase
MTPEQQALQASLRDWAKRAETALELLGPAGAAESEAGQEFLLTRCLSIAGGTTQILLNQIAERVLGLPR